MARTQNRWYLLIAVAALWLPVVVADLADVYLKSGLKLRGDVKLTDDEVIVRNEMGTVRFPLADVERVVPVRDIDATQPGTPASQPAEVIVADAAEVAENLAAPPLLSPLDIQRLKMSELCLDGRAEKVRMRFLDKADQREIPRQVLRDLRQRPDFQLRWQEVLTYGQPHEKLQLIVAETGTKYAGKILINSDPEVFATFRSKVLPIVARGCARSGCHGGPEAAVFRFPEGSPQSEAYAYTTFLLLDRLDTRDGPLIDRDNPRGSVLLSYMLPPKETMRSHPPVTGRRRFTATLRSERNTAYERIVDWIDTLRVPHLNYQLDYVPPDAETPAEQPEAPAGPETPAEP
ncbi:MAG: hypothetical protein ABIG44_17395 [Planctomycetota bacterium]